MKMQKLLPLIAFCSIGFAQSQVASQQQTLSVLDDADYVFRRYEELTGQINFSGWNVEYAFVEAKQQAIAAHRKAIRDIKPEISRLRISSAPSASELLQVYDLLLGVERSAVVLGRDVGTHGKSYSLAIELTNLSTRIAKQAPAFRDALSQQLRAQEFQLRVCLQPAGASP